MAQRMENPLVKRVPSMCAMMPAGNDDAAGECGRQTCMTHVTCGDRLKPDNEDLLPFVEWQEYNERVLKGSAQGHHQSNVWVFQKLPIQILKTFSKDGLSIVAYRYRHMGVSVILIGKFTQNVLKLTDSI